MAHGATQPRITVRTATPTFHMIADDKPTERKTTMEEKKMNQVPEIGDEKLDNVNGGVKAKTTGARSTWCSTCGKNVNPEQRRDGDYCPECRNRL